MQPQMKPQMKPEMKPEMKPKRRLTHLLLLSCEAIKCPVMIK